MVTEKASPIKQNLRYYQTNKNFDQYRVVQNYTLLLLFSHSWVCNHSSSTHARQISQRFYNELSQTFIGVTSTPPLFSLKDTILVSHYILDSYFHVHIFSSQTTVWGLPVDYYGNVVNDGGGNSNVVQLSAVVTNDDTGTSLTWLVQEHNN